jgi:DNA-binding transcriptional ArsR family regulator
MDSIPLYEAKADLFRTLGHPVRIRVLELLQDGPRPVSELLRHIDVEASNLSHQLGVLRRSGLVRSYRLATTDVAQLLLHGRRILLALGTEQQGLLAELRDSANSA